MKTFRVTAAQGDVVFRRVDNLPDGLVEAPRESDGSVLIARSETLHHHRMFSDNATLYYKEGFDFDAWLVVKEPTTLEHLRPFDTHEAILFEPGVYHVRRQREYTPEGFRRVED